MEALKTLLETVALLFYSTVLVFIVILLLLLQSTLCCSYYKSVSHEREEGSPLCCFPCGFYFTVYVFLWSESNDRGHQTYDLSHKNALLFQNWLCSMLVTIFKAVCKCQGQRNIV